MIDALKFLFQRDIQRLYDEVDAYQKEENLWILEGSINNTAGNLAMHLAGNLQHFIGHLLGGSDYKRQRDREFGDKNVPKNELLKSIKNAEQAVDHALENIDTATLEESFPQQVFKTHYTTAQMLIHLQGHLNYHLGQINYHRRLLDK